MELRNSLESLLMVDLRNDSIAHLNNNHKNRKWNKKRDTTKKKRRWSLVLFFRASSVVVDVNCELKERERKEEKKEIIQFQIDSSSESLVIGFRENIFRNFFKRVGFLRKSFADHLWFLFLFYFYFFFHRIPDVMEKQNRVDFNIIYFILWNDGTVRIW